MRAFFGALAAALSVQPTRQREREAEAQRTLPERRKASRTKHRSLAERQAIRAIRAKLEEPRRIRKAARAARKANRS